MGFFVDNITKNATEKLEAIHEGSVISGRSANIINKLDQRQIDYEAPEAARYDIAKFNRGIIARISQHLGTTQGVTLGEVVTGANGKQTITATLTGEAFRNMELLAEEADRNPSVEHTR